jgi:hypothetical protein
MAKDSDQTRTPKPKSNGSSGNGSAANLGFEAKLWPDLLSALGFEAATHTGKSGDGGVDATGEPRDRHHLQHQDEQREPHGELGERDSGR